MFAKRRYVALSFLLLLVLVTGWYPWGDEERAEVSRDVGDSVDYYLKEFVATAMNEQGLPRHRLEAVSMLHYADSGNAELIRPYYYVYREDGLNWSLRSEFAQMQEAGTRLFLQGKVHIEREATATEGVIEIDTHNLWLYPNEEFAESSEAVTMRDSRGVTHGIGMRIDLKAGELQLLSRVRGEYAANN